MGEVTLTQRMQTRYHAHDCELRNSLVYDEYHIYDYYRVNGLVTPLKAARAENPVPQL
jgi:hypothetical protein